MSAPATHVALRIEDARMLLAICELYVPRRPGSATLTNDVRELTERVRGAIESPEGMSG